MIRLEHINIEDFKKEVYAEYVKLFPDDEIKPLNILKASYNKGILKIFKIVDKTDLFIGFIITDSIENGKYILLDYFAILDEHQNKGYGTKAIELLKKESKEYRGIFIEVEKEGLGKTEQENKMRTRRTAFYKRLGCYSLNYDMDLFGVIFKPYILPVEQTIEDESKIIQEIEKIYISIMGKERFKNNCSIIKLDNNNN